MSPDLPWWHETVVYQVYPRSFADTDGDGIGDLPGVRSRLRYLADLGVDAIWLSPFYPSPLADGGYDVSDYFGVDPLLGTLADFDGLVADAAAHRIRVIVDLVPNHCSADHPFFRQALAAAPGSSQRERFLFRDGRGPDGAWPPNNWQSTFGGPAWTRITEPDGTPGQWYLHLFDPGQPDWNWRNPEIPAYFEKVIRFWLDRGAAGLRVDVAHGLFKDPELADTADPAPSHARSGYYHQPELHELYKSWRGILDSYPADVFPGRRTAIGEVWYDTIDVLGDYVTGDALPQVFNFEFLTTGWDSGALRAAIAASVGMTAASGSPWVLGNHDVPRPVTRYGLTSRPGAGAARQLTPDTTADLCAGSRRARAAALLLLALPGSVCVYQGEELGLPEVLDLPPEVRADPAFRRSGERQLGRDGCRVPLPWSGAAPPYGFSPAAGDAQARTWLPQPTDWQHYTVESQQRDPDSFLGLYRAALRLRREHPGLVSGSMTWLDGPPGMLSFSREPGFAFAANLGTAPAPLPSHDRVLLASGPVEDGRLPPDTAAWLETRPPAQ